MGPSLSPEDVDALFALADLAVRGGLAGEEVPRIDPQALRPTLREPCGVFVTLEVAGALNGCIGSIVAREPLAVAVPELAWRAAFADPRLPPLASDQYPSLELKLSLISPLAPIEVGSEAALAAVLCPGVDGLLIRGGGRSATFLPAVWEKLEHDPATFLRHLWAKAGLRPGQWPPGMEAWRYTTSDYRRKVADIARAA
jgi:uncharacterized protein